MKAIHETPSLNPILALTQTYAAYIGIDWSDRKHAICLFDCATHSKELAILEARPDAIATWVESLLQRLGGRQIAI